LTVFLKCWAALCTEVFALFVCSSSGLLILRNVDTFVIKTENSINGNTTILRLLLKNLKKT
jgi:hypothetical protein